MRATDDADDLDDPDVQWWAGRTACALCGWRGVSIIPIGRDHDEPIVPMECSSCGNWTVGPDDDDGGPG